MVFNNYNSFRVLFNESWRIAFQIRVRDGCKKIVLRWGWLISFINWIIIYMFKGSFPASLFFKLCTYIIIPTLVIIYWISQAYGHEEPFPNCWISKVAQHYPEFVFFRIATISGAVLAALGWFTNYFYLKTICKEHAFNLNKYHP